MTSTTFNNERSQSNFKNQDNGRSMFEPSESQASRAYKDGIKDNKHRQLTNRVDINETDSRIRDKTCHLFDENEQTKIESKQLSVKKLESKIEDCYVIKQIPCNLSDNITQNSNDIFLKDIKESKKANLKIPSRHNILPRQISTETCGTKTDAESKTENNITLHQHKLALNLPKSRRDRRERKSVQYLKKDDEIPKLSKFQKIDIDPLNIDKTDILYQDNESFLSSFLCCLYAQKTFVEFLAETAKTFLIEEKKTH